MTASVGSLVPFNVAPTVTVGFRAALDVAIVSSLSLGLDLRADLPASGEAVETYIVAASIVPCIRYPKPFFFCGLVSLGDFHETGVDITHARSGDALYAAVGPRVGAELPIGRRFFVLAHADAAFILLRNPVSVGAVMVFQLPVVAPSVGLAGGVAF